VFSTRTTTSRDYFLSDVKDPCPILSNNPFRPPPLQGQKNISCSSSTIFPLLYVLDTTTSLLNTMNSTDDGTQQDCCHLFRKPAELRNAMYEYALTDGRPMHFDRPIRFDSRGFGPHGVSSKQISRTPGCHGLSAFMSALSNQLLEINQLRFVSKQLYAETHGLALRYNDLSFSNVKDAGYFLEHCAPFHLPRIRTLTVQWTRRSQDNNDPAAHWQPITQLCTTYPTFID
jgi:hypothetical protein